MQRRCDSADIVTNPSLPKRNPNLRHCDSIRKSHSESFQFDSLPFPSSRQHTVSAIDIDLSYRARSSGYVCLPNLRQAESQRQTDSAQVVSHTPIMLMPAVYPTPGSSSSELSSSCESSVSSVHSRTSTSSHPIDLLGGREGRLPTPPPNCQTSIRSLPTLAKETVKQYSYVDSLVDVATMITQTLWPCQESSSPCNTLHSVRMISYFITETSRKSKTSLSTMQLALLYCIRLKREQDKLTRQCASSPSDSTTLGADAATVPVGSTCARRNFLSALILASKYLQDRNFSNKAWSKISSISVSEINLREREFLEITRWNLDVKHDVFSRWSGMMGQCIDEIRYGTIFGELQACQNRWTFVIQEMIHVAEDRMNHFMLYAASSDSDSRQLEQKQEVRRWPQLSTPMATPGVELSGFALPSSTASRDEVPAETPHTEPVPQELDIPDCPFFDEFIKSTPRDHNLCEEAVRDHPGSITAQTHYLTPESMRTASPTSSELGVSHETPELDVGSCTMDHCDPTQDPVSHSQDSAYAPPTPLMRPYPSFTFFSESFIVQQQDTEVTCGGAVRQRNEDDTEDGSGRPLNKKLKRSRS